MAEEHVHISKTISKLGTHIPSVSLPAGHTCRPDAPCAKICYAKHGRFQFPSVQTSLWRNLNIWEENPEKFEREVMMGAYFSKWFRWHSSGDIPAYDYLEMMVRIAKALPGTRFLCFTKRDDFVNAYLSRGNVFPSNLIIVLSAWGDWVPQNPYHLPMSYVALKSGEGSIPEDAHPCSGFCGDCIMSEHNCWALKYGESVVFGQH